ncbi:MAG: class I SAM-dependent methyltransferase [Elusimicrobia bacterium]|nr:class I SAM-dependent methyltransferase [Elusimicrobiota bacterium]
MIKRSLKKVFDRLGYEVRKKGAPRLGYDLEDEARRLIEKVRPYTMLPDERLITLYQQVVHCESAGVPGDFVECGVWKGGAVALMALANLKRGAARRSIHLFDAFTQICEPDKAVDGAKAVRQAREFGRGGSAEGRMRPLEGFYDSMGGPGTLEGNKDLLERQVRYDPAFLHYHRGWFQETMPQDAPKIGRIAILRLDGDWYASTKVCLEHLYDKVVKGGFVVVDDYGCYEGCRKAVDEFRSERKIADYLHHIDADGRYWLKS